MSERGTGREGAANATRQRQEPGRPLAEWTTLAISLGILLVLVGLIGYQFLVREVEPAVIATEPLLHAVRQDQGRFYLPVLVTNDGDRTAENVRVQAALRSDQREPEAAQFQIQFLAGGETARGVFVFQHDPREGRLAVGVVSYLEP